RIEKKHRVTIARAAKLVPTLAILKRRNLGCELVVYDPLNVMSCAMAQLKADNSYGFFDFGQYRNNDPRKARIRKDLAWLVECNPKKYGHYKNREREMTEQELRESLAPGGPLHQKVIEGGEWWQATEIERARRGGDIETYNRLKAEKQAKIDADRDKIAPQLIRYMGFIYARMPEKL